MFTPYSVRGQRGSNPGHPRPLILAKRDLPGGLEGLKEFIRLEESAHSQGIEKTKGDQEEEDCGRWWWWWW